MINIQKIMRGEDREEVHSNNPGMLELFRRASLTDWEKWLFYSISLLLDCELLKNRDLSYSIIMPLLE